jgi:hypothetical protein
MIPNLRRLPLGYVRSTMKRASDAVPASVHLVRGEGDVARGIKVGHGRSLLRLV